MGSGEIVYTGEELMAKATAASNTKKTVRCPNCKTKIRISRKLQ